MIINQIGYSKDILDKRYFLYTWLDSKVNLSLVINSALLGFSYVLLEKGDVLIVSKILVIIAVLLISVSIFICLRLTNPAMKSPIWKKYNNKMIVKQPRTSIGIENFEPEEYKRTMKKIDLELMLEYNLDQIIKMNAIVNNSSRQLKKIVNLSSFALLILVFAFIYPYVKQLVISLF